MFMLNMLLLLFLLDIKVINDDSSSLPHIARDITSYHICLTVQGDPTKVK